MHSKFKEMIEKKMSEDKDGDAEKKKSDGKRPTAEELKKIRRKKSK